jgi:hypothetical protein
MVECCFSPLLPKAAPSALALSLTNILSRDIWRYPIDPTLLLQRSPPTAPSCSQYIQSMAANRSSQGYPSTPAKFIQRFPHHERNTIHSISQSLARASGSRWTANHLESCRVILKPPRPHMKHLDIFQGYLEPARIYIKNCHDIFEPLSAVSPQLLKKCSFAELRKIGGGFGAVSWRFRGLLCSLG